MSRGGVVWPEELGQPLACSPPPYTGAAATPLSASGCDAVAPKSIVSIAAPSSDPKPPSGCRSPCNGSVIWRLTCCPTWLLTSHLQRRAIGTTPHAGVTLAIAPKRHACSDMQVSLPLVRFDMKPHTPPQTAWAQRAPQSQSGRRVQGRTAPHTWRTRRRCCRRSRCSESRSWSPSTAPSRAAHARCCCNGSDGCSCRHSRCSRCSIAQ